jgi:hypothetical protein
VDKPRVLIDYDSLDESVVERIKLQYPQGFEQHLLKLPNKDGDFVSTLPFDAGDTYYLIRMTSVEARELIEEDDDYDDFGKLKDLIREEYEEKYEDD